MPGFANRECKYAQELSIQTISLAFSLPQVDCTSSPEQIALLLASTGLLRAAFWPAQHLLFLAAFVCAVLTSLRLRSLFRHLNAFLSPIARFDFLFSHLFCFFSLRPLDLNLLLRQVALIFFANGEVRHLLHQEYPQKSTLS